MKMANNLFKRGLVEGRSQVGLWLSLSNSLSAEVIAGSDYDWVMLDMEHSPNDYFSILSQLQVFKAGNTTALVRPDWNDSVVVKRLLDMGVPGLLFPMIQSAEEARMAVAATRYPPNGIRGVAGSTRATQFGRVSDYTARVEQETAVIMQVETRLAVDHVEEIAAMDGVDAVFFGPADIAADLGLIGQPLHDDVWSLIFPAAQKLIDGGMPVGTLVLDPQFAIKLFEFGFSFVACGADTGLLAKSADDLLAKVRQEIS